MARPVLLLCFLATVVASPNHVNGQIMDRTGPGTIRGTIRGHFQGGTRELGFAVVEARWGDMWRSIAADSTGRYVADGIPSGEITLSASHPGYASLTVVVTLPPGGAVDVDLELQARPIALPTLEVEQSREAVGDADIGIAGVGAAPLPEIELQALDLAPGVGQAGLVDVVRSLPGNDPTDPTDVLFMRGSTTDLKLVLLDGVPVYTPFHVAGLLKSFEPAVLGGADLHVGGAPARYDGGLSHILELRTRSARRDRVRASGSVDLLAASAAIEAPLGPRAGVIVSARALHDLGRVPLGGSRPYGYRDALVTLDADPATGHSLRATGFWNAESVLLDFADESNDARWSNLAGTAGYAVDLGTAKLDVSGGWSAYRASLPLQPAPRPDFPLPAAVLASADNDRVRAVAELSWGPVVKPIRAGLSFERIEAQFRAETATGGQSASSRGSSSGIGAFFDMTRPIVAGLTLRAGLRADHFSAGSAHLAPRAEVLWELGPQALLTVAAGRYHQPTRSPDAEVERTLADVVDDGVPASELMPVATADHVVLSLDQRIGEAVSLGLEGFWKRYDGLSSESAETIRSSGIDVRVLSAGERVTGWLGYGLSWFWSEIDLSGHAADFAGRQLLTAGLSGRLAGPFRGEARVAYGAGLPYSSIPFRSFDAAEVNAPGGSDGPEGTPTLESGGDSPIVGGLDEEFLRLDIELQAVFEPEWGGKRWRITPYVRILNALDRRDALFYTFQPWRDASVTPLAERAFLPLLGIAFSY